MWSPCRVELFYIDREHCHHPQITPRKCTQPQERNNEHATPKHITNTLARTPQLSSACGYDCTWKWVGGGALV